MEGDAGQKDVWKREHVREKNKDPKNPFWGFFFECLFLKPFSFQASGKFGFVFSTKLVISIWSSQPWLVRWCGARRGRDFRSVQKGGFGWELFGIWREWGWKLGEVFAVVAKNADTVRFYDVTSINKKWHVVFFGERKKGKDNFCGEWRFHRGNS